MLFLQFQLDDDRFVLDAGRVAEVLPLVELRRLPQSPPEVAGLCNYRGQPVPVLDLARLLLGRPAREALSTRILVLHHRAAADQPALLGVIVEQATEIFRRDPREFTTGAVPGLGPVLTDSQGMIQWIDPEQLVPAHLHARLLPPTIPKTASVAASGDGVTVYHAGDETD